MPTYLFWGEDDFAITQAVENLKQQVLDLNWLQFNYHQLPGDTTDSIIEGLNQAMTPPFGMGGRLVWLTNTNTCQSCSEVLLAELQRTLPVIPDSAHLLFTTSKKIDGRLKSTKLLKKYGEVKEFALIPPWKTAEIIRKVHEVSQTVGVKLTRKGTETLADAVGNNTRQLWSELEKLKTYGESSTQPLDGEIISRLVVVNTQNSLQLAHAIREGNQDLALELVTDLFYRNEPPLRIVATLVGQFRTWIKVKLMVEQGEKDNQVIANFSEVGNPKRIYFLRKEVAGVSSSQLIAILPILLELEVSLKRGAKPLDFLQTQVIKMCQAIKENRFYFDI